MARTLLQLSDLPGRGRSPSLAFSKNKLQAPVRLKQDKIVIYKENFLKRMHKVTTAVAKKDNSLVEM